jgi:hypothetical protein
MLVRAGFDLGARLFGGFGWRGWLRNRFENRRRGLCPKGRRKRDRRTSQEKRPQPHILSFDGQTANQVIVA